MSMQLTSTSEIEAGATIQRIEDNETREVAEVERDEDGQITTVVLTNTGGLVGAPDTLDTAALNAWVVL